MRYALTSEQISAAERRAVEESGIALDDLMVAAGTALADAVADLSPEGRIVVLCGPGNNGGDGWVAATSLLERGRDVMVHSVREPSDLAGAAAEAARRAVGRGVPHDVLPMLDVEELRVAACIVDALLGVGAKGLLRSPIDSWVEVVNQSGSIVVSADVPTGVDSDTGQVLTTAVRADATVTFSAPKRGIVLLPGAAYAGEVRVEDVGVPSAMLEAPGSPEVWSVRDYSDLVILPEPEAHKNSRGRLLVVAGSGAFPGAAVLATKGAQRSGAGYVTLCVPEPVVTVAQCHLVASPVIGLAAHRGHTFAARAADAIVDLARDYDAVVLGPGLTLADGAVALSRALVSRLDCPLLIDADGLNALVDAVGLLRSRRAPTVITPHPGELARLLQMSVGDVQADRVSCATRLETEWVTCVLKGAATVVAGDDRVVLNTSGTPALATAGTGDVLSGLIGGLLAQGMRPFDASALGVWLHGRAGEAAAADLTPVCVTAEDLPGCIPVAVSELLESW